MSGPPFEEYGYLYDNFTTTSTIRKNSTDSTVAAYSSWHDVRKPTRNRTTWRACSTSDFSDGYSKRNRLKTLAKKMISNQMEEKIARLKIELKKNTFDCRCKVEKTKQPMWFNNKINSDRGK